MLRKSRKQLTVRFLQRTVLFLVCFSSGLLLFFLFGNMQEFLDATQSMILLILSGSALVSGLLSAILFMIELVLVLRKKKHYLLPIVISSFCMLYSSVLAVVSHAILLISRGY